MATKVLIPEAASDIFEIPVNLIVADPKQNTRKELTDIDKLAKSIDYEGQQTPVLVAKREDGKFDLIYGFRRFAAISWPKDKGGLEWETITARVVEPMPPEERLLTNLIENMAREDLSSYDTAMACQRLIELNKEMTGPTIANKVGKSAQYVNNLLRALENLPIDIKQRWKEEQSEDWDEKHKGTKKVLTTDNLNRLAKKSMSDEERRIEYKKLTGELKAEEAKAAKLAAGITQPAAPSVPRASKAALENALKAAKATKKKTEFHKGAIAALNFALGETDGIKGVYAPEETEEDESN